MSVRADDFHDWRKHIKRSHYHAPLLREVALPWANAYAPPLRQLEVLLGHRQDLFILDQLLSSQPDELGIDLRVRLIRQMIDAARRDLDVRAFDIAGRVFDFEGPGVTNNLISLRSRIAL